MSKKEKMKSIINKKNILIAGPCSAETEEQLVETALQLKMTGAVDVLRAGIWKPRTNPGGFEGVGVKGLPWLLRAKELTGLPTAVEVATAKHVEDALSFDTDILWIGARTTVNPFSVQHIADAVRGTKTTVMIKNPVSTDIKLWIGAVERIQKVGIENIGLIHRGFTTYGEVNYRNTPMWQIPIEMKRLFPEIPLICDPSHICGKTETLKKVIQKSVDLDFDGLMVESHIDPHLALTDAAQQVRPRELEEIMRSIIWKRASKTEVDFNLQLDVLRDQINLIDDELLAKLADRMMVSKEIGSLKKEHQVTILQSNRWSEILEKTQLKAKKLELGETFIQQYLEAVHLESIRNQNLIKNT